MFFHKRVTCIFIMFNKYMDIRFKCSPIYKFLKIIKVDHDIMDDRLEHFKFWCMTSQISTGIEWISIFTCIFFLFSPCEVKWSKYKLCIVVFSYLSAYCSHTFPGLYWLSFIYSAHQVISSHSRVPSKVDRFYKFWNISLLYKTTFTGTYNLVVVL